mmetsp:Transcript_31008/g.68083  ORF Transcript_31008/g.68083 Transcript_31008/m.68083 type:complete len:159 (+) Transcript_31008:189-665(+)
MAMAMTMLLQMRVLLPPLRQIRPRSDRQLTINDLRRSNAQRWEEVVQLREMLLARQRRRRGRLRRQQDDGTTSTTSSSGDTNGSATHGQQSLLSASGPAQNEGSALSSSAATDVNGDSNLRQMEHLILPMLPRSCVVCKSTGRFFSQLNFASMMALVA